MTAVPMYLLIYTFTNLGAWAVIVALRRKDVIGEHIDEMNGLFFKHPVAAILMLIFLLSLAGIPPTAGFIAKYYLFAAAVQTDHIVLAVVAVLNAAISAYFYLRIVVAMFMREANREDRTGLFSGASCHACCCVDFHDCGSGFIRIRSLRWRDRPRF